MRRGGGAGRRGEEPEEEEGGWSWRGKELGDGGGGRGEVMFTILRWWLDDEEVRGEREGGAFRWTWNLVVGWIWDGYALRPAVVSARARRAGRLCALRSTARALSRATPSWCHDRASPLTAPIERSDKLY